MDVATLAAAVLCALVVTGFVAALLPRVGIIDVPNHRSSHDRPVPRGGGVGVLAGIGAGVLVAHPDHLLLLGLCGAVVLGVLGFVDDVRSLPAVLRLGLQVGVGAVTTTLLIPETGPTMPVALLAGSVAIVWLVGYVNVFNFMDGSNGLAAFNALIAGACFAWVGSVESKAALLVGGTVLLGATAGFLPWNFPRARIFLGDVGSYSIGFLVAWLALIGVLTTDRWTWCLAPLLLVLIDTSLTLARRAQRGESLMEAHREHVYQRLTTTPGSALPAVVASIFSVAFVLGAALPDLGTLGAWVLLAAGYVSLPGLIARRVAIRN
jgi:UDP-GlcNAc:undecaprenyl-phosphate/decaprenyl-phosphate GlcNAc-1-phosphate transferase